MNAEHVSVPVPSTNQKKMTTLTGGVYREAIDERQTDAATTVYSWPHDPTPVAEVGRVVAIRIRVADLKGIMLRSWRLECELGED